MDVDFRGVVVSNVSGVLMRLDLRLNLWWGDHSRSMWATYGVFDLMWVMLRKNQYEGHVYVP